MALRRTASITAPLAAAAAVFMGVEGEKPEVGQARAHQPPCSARRLLKPPQP